MNVQEINAAIKNVDSNEVSDGYHTFGELYDHRISLFILVCVAMDAGRKDAGNERGAIWRSKKHSDGSEWEGWFIMGIGLIPGRQITYHLPISKWEQTEFAFTRDMAPEWDGHTSADVLQRLGDLLEAMSM